jgi:hypothetical protein
LAMIRPSPGGRFTTENAPRDLLIRLAYNIRDFQISGAPSWASSERYDINAKAEGNATRADAAHAPIVACGPTQARAAPRNEREPDLRTGGCKERSENRAVEGRELYHTRSEESSATCAPATRPLVAVATSRAGEAGIRPPSMPAIQPDLPYSLHCRSNWG